MYLMVGSGECLRFNLAFFAAFALSWYHVPYTIRTLIHNYYRNVFSYIDGPGWSSNWFWVSVGVLQGCTASTILFNLAFQLILDIHRAQAQKLHFNFKKAKILVSSPTYADDIALVTGTPQQNQNSVEIFLDAIEWSGCFVLKVQKCRSFAAMYFKRGHTQFVKHLPGRRYSSFDPVLKVKAVAIIFIGNDVGKDKMFKYLGHYIQDNFDTRRVANLVSAKLAGWIDVIE